MARFEFPRVALPTVRIPQQIRAQFAPVVNYLQAVPSKGILGAAGVTPQQFYGAGNIGGARGAAIASLGAVPGGGVVSAESLGARVGESSPWVAEGLGRAEPSLAEGIYQIPRAAGEVGTSTPVTRIVQGVDVTGKSWYQALRPSLQFVGKAALYGGGVAGAGYAGYIGLSALGQGAYNLGTGVGAGIGNLLGLGQGGGGSGGGSSGGGTGSSTGGPLDTILSSPLILLVLIGGGLYLLVQHEKKKPEPSQSSK